MQNRQFTSDISHIVFSITRLYKNYKFFKA